MSNKESQCGCKAGMRVHLLPCFMMKSQLEDDRFSHQPGPAREYFIRSGQPSTTICSQSRGCERAVRRAESVVSEESSCRRSGQRAVTQFSGLIRSLGNGAVLCCERSGVRWVNRSPCSSLFLLKGRSQDFALHKQKHWDT